MSCQTISDDKTDFSFISRFRIGSQSELCVLDGVRPSSFSSGEHVDVGSNPEVGICWQKTATPHLDVHVFITFRYYKIY